MEEVEEGKPKYTGKVYKIIEEAYVGLNKGRLYAELEYSVAETLIAFEKDKYRGPTIIKTEYTTLTNLIADIKTGEIYYSYTRDYMESIMERSWDDKLNSGLLNNMLIEEGGIDMKKEITL